MPNELAGSRLGAVLPLLPRFTDGDAHRRNRTVTEKLITRLESSSIAQHIDRALADLRHTFLAHDWMIAVCPRSMAHAFGIESATLVEDVSALARGRGPGAARQDTIAAIAGCDRLWQALAPAMPDHGERAAAIGLLFQGFDAVTALIGNGLIAGARRLGDVRRLLVERPPIRTTRRYDDGGHPILVDLEAATRATGGYPSYAFGFGPHRCPGQVLAFTVASHALERAPRLVHVPDPVRYLPYPNANVPDLRAVELDWSAL